MARKEDQDAPVESTATEPTTPLAEGAATPATAPTPTTGRRGLGGLALAGIVGGSVVAAALLFGGGVAVGVALPDRAPLGIAQGGLPGGEAGMHEGFPGAQAGPRGDGARPDGPDRRGDRGGDSGTDSDSDSDGE